MSKFYKSELLITNDGPPLLNGIVEVGEGGRIVSVFQDDDFTDCEFINGVIIPGFVNAHCHLELSHLKGKINSLQNGMAGFIDQLFALRNETSEQAKQTAMQSMDESMWKEGVVAVGDISNTADSITIKKNSRITYHTFIEVMGLSEKVAEARFNNGVDLLNEFKSEGLKKSSLALHAPYSISKRLISLVNEGLKANSSSSIHINESEDEIDFCSKQYGNLKTVFEKYKLPVNDFDNWSEGSVLLNIVKALNHANPFILVHNVKTTKEEIAIACELNKNLYWCLCVNANRYITGEPPNLSLFNNDELNVVIGTDSLASNYQLSVWEELKSIAAKKSEMPFERLIKWATLNGANALSLGSNLGKIKPGYHPGLVQILNVNTVNPKITANSYSKNIDV
ncbi:MAG: amidohydrolase family protein [Bacteroidota bacterium]